MQHKPGDAYIQLAAALAGTAATYTDDGYQALVYMKNSGMNQQQVYELLITQRREAQAAADEQQEDRILELMDMVTGYCAPHRRIWAEPYYPPH